jgi:hypothetical protein
LNGVDGMSAKQDRAAPRTVADIERKYNFGKSFAEVMGLVEDTRNEVDSAYSELKDEIAKESTSIRRDTTEIITEAQKAIGDLTQAVEQKVTAEDVSITIKETLDNGVDKVEIKETGYVFDSDGLKISKAGEQMANLLDNTGMYVKRSGTEILTANSDGVTAFDLHAKTFLKIGSGDGRCRFEDYGNTRIGCFWTGG